MVKLNILYNLIKRYYDELETHIKWQNNYGEMYGNNLEVQYNVRRILNNTISEYIALGGKRDISKYCKYYV